LIAFLERRKRTPDLFEAIWSEELPGVLNQALAGYKRLLERGTRFKLPRAVRQATTAWLQQANPLPAFIASQCCETPQDRCLMQDFYRGYSAWTKAMGYTLTQTQQTVTRNLEHLHYQTKGTNRGIAIVGLTLVHARND